MADQDDPLRMSEVFRNLFIERSLFRNTFAAIVRFLAVDQVPMKSMRVIRCYGLFAAYLAIIKASVYAGKMMIDDRNGAYRPNWVAWTAVDTGLARHPAQGGNITNFETTGARTFEECTLSAHYKRKLGATVRFDSAQLPDQFDRIVPAEITQNAHRRNRFAPSPSGRKTAICGAPPHCEQTVVVTMGDASEGCAMNSANGCTHTRAQKPAKPAAPSSPWT